MSFIGEWMRQPQKVWLRRAIFQVHLWLGIGLGLYILMISVTGSAIVARREMVRALVPDSVPILPSGRLDPEALRAVAQQAYPGFEVESVTNTRRPRGYGRRGGGAPQPPTTDTPVKIVLERGSEVEDRLFDPYTGRDLGAFNPWQLGFLNEVVDLHDNLLSGRTGRMVNGIAAIAVTLLVISGLIIWWPGSKRWKQSLYVQPRVGWRSQIWQLHSMLGIWLFVALLLWSVTGIYFAFPEPFQMVAGWVHPPEVDDGIAAERLINWFVNLHFGRFGGMGVRTTWIVLGLVPSILFITGAILWWTKVVRPRLNALKAARAA